MKDCQYLLSHIKLRAEELSLWKELIYRRTGLCFSDSRLSGIYRGLNERMHQCQIMTCQEYYNYIVSHSENFIEWQHFLEFLLNNESDFFRHKPSFDALYNHVFPDYFSSRSLDQPFKMWSVGCSIGQEAYSLVMTYLNFLSSRLFISLDQLIGSYSFKINVKVIGSDISLKAIKKAKSGQYKLHEIRSLAEDYKNLYFSGLRKDSSQLFQVISQICELVDFGYVNVFDPEGSAFSPLPFIGGHGEGVDVIFCQNVLIYFKLEDRLSIVNKLCKRLRPGGCLFLGPSEAIGLKVLDMMPIRLDNMLIYQRET